ncbi:MAG: MoaD/ThiS family protein [Planctomycetales bacterium]
MNVQVKLFAAARQLVGKPVVIVDVADIATVADLRAALLKQFPVLRPLQHHLMFSVDQEYASPTDAVTAISEVAVIPPVSGG